MVVSQETVSCYDCNVAVDVAGMKFRKSRVISTVNVVLLLSFFLMYQRHSSPLPFPAMGGEGIELEPMPGTVRVSPPPPSTHTNTPERPVCSTRFVESGVRTAAGIHNSSRL